MPELDIGIQWIWDGFVSLHKARQWTTGQPQPIALHDILAYSEFVGLHRDDAGLLLKMIQQLDDAYFDRMKTKANNGGTRSSNRRKARKTRR